MEKLTLLRSLEARGRPLGTERSTLPSRGARPEGRNEFARDVDEARQAERSEARRTDRKRAEEADSRERSRDRSAVDEERGRDRVDAEAAPQEPQALRLQDQLAETPLGLEGAAASAESTSDEEGGELASAESSKGHTPSTRAQAAQDEGQSATEAAKLARMAADTGRPVSLTQPALRGGTAPGAAGLPGAQGAQGAGAEVGLTAELPSEQGPQTGVAKTGAGPESFEVEASAETPAEGVESARSGPPERAAAVNSTQPGAETIQTTVDGAPRREQASAIQPKAAPVQPPPPPPSPEQAASVLRQFRLHLTPGMRQATIQLQPAALGRIAIRITMRDGEARAEIRAESPTALEALERHVPELRAALEGQGIESTDIELTLGFEQGGSSTPERFEDRLGTDTANNGEAATTLASADLTRSLLSETGVDTYA